MTEALCVAFLLAGSFLAFPWTRRRFIHYGFVFVANAAFFALGPRAAVLVAAAGFAGAALQLARSRSAETLGRVTSLASAAIASCVAMGVAHAVRRWTGAAEYPVPFGHAGDAGRFTFALVVVYLVFTSTKEALLWLARDRAAAPAAAASPVVETSTSLYALGGVVGAPMQFAAYAVYGRDTVGAWACVMLWSVLVNAVIAREVARMRHVGDLMRELAAKERLAAIGEVTARIVHQTRHQLGILGIIVHRIERRITALPEPDGEVVRGELAKLGEVQDELRGMLARDLRGEETPWSEPPAAARASYASLVRSVTVRLEGLATSRGIRVDVSELTPAEAHAPRDADHVAQALFNVLENAIVAARRQVRIDATACGADLVVSIVDDGPGLDPAIASRAFEPFVTTKPDGTGMGLPIARAAVDEEGGSLLVGRAPRGGLAVDLVFPRRAAGAAT